MTNKKTQLVFGFTFIFIFIFLFLLIHVFKLDTWKTDVPQYYYYYYLNIK